MSRTTYDAIVIGTGQAGKPLAGALAMAGWRTAIIERGRVGGVCVVEGCTPTKTMVASARAAYVASRAGVYGVRTGPISVDMEVVRKRKRDIVDSWSAGSQKGLERHELLDLIFGHARFSGPKEVAVETPEGQSVLLSSETIFINTGARPGVPDLPGLDSVPFLDSKSVMELGEVPDHLIVLGGGFIGLEFGQMFRRFGAEVTILEYADRLARSEDDDVAEALREILEEDGIGLEFDVRASGVSQSDDGGVVLEFEQDGASRFVTGSHLLVATGRVPNTDDLGLEAAGLEVNDRGFITVNDRLETAVDGIYALGDVNGGPPFTHTSYDDFRVVRDNLLGGGGGSTSGRMLPYTVFTDPQLGRIGLTEREAREKGYDVRVASLPLTKVARAIEMDETRGLMKAVVDGDTNQILGAAILAVEGGEVASVIQMAMMGEVPYTAIKDGVFSHPTLSESLNNLFMAMDA